MASIQTKIQKAYIVSVISGGCIAILMGGFLATGIYRNQALIQTMVDEYRIIGQTQSIIDAYNAVTKNPSSEDNRTAYTAHKSSLSANLKRLESVIVYDLSRNTLTGIKNTVEKVITECDAGITGLEQGAYESVSDHYARANKYNEFVADTTRMLLQNELQYLADIQMSIRRTFFIGITIGAISFLALTTWMIWQARTFASSIASPLIQLTNYAKRIALGETTTHEIAPIPDADDEVKSLVQSIQTMVASLSESYAAVKHANDELAQATQTLESKNKELKEMNDIMVGRELKMIDLKKEIESLKHSN